MGGGGGGGGIGYGSRDRDAMRRALEATRATEEAKRIEADVARLLQDELAAYNNIDRDAIRERLDEIEAALGDRVEFDEFLYAGSVAKHTAVDGLSDVDALMIFSPEDIGNDTPEQIRQRCKGLLDDELDREDVSDVSVGRLAITVKYRDGMEIQILPAVQLGNAVGVPNTAGTRWIETRPDEFRQQLTQANERMGGKLVPAVKLFKSVLDSLPAQQQLISGYHAEALAVHAAKTFPEGRAKTHKSVLTHIVDSASRRVMEPMPDVTGQSTSVDRDLGPARSTQRRLVQDALGKLYRRMTTAKSVDEWRRILGVDK
jgi:hypothetical protein